MSKADVDMDGTEQEVADLSNEEVVTKYRLAADISNKVLKAVVQACVPGALVVQICEAGDKMLEDETGKVYKKKKVEDSEDGEGQSRKIEKGIAFPTCLSVNNVAAHFSPLKDDTTALKVGDVVKIDLGAHIDGFIAVVGHTVVVGAPAEPITGPVGNALAAVNTAAEVVLRLLKPGVKNLEVTEKLQKVFEAYQVRACEGLQSHELKQFVIDGERVIPGKKSVEQKVEEFEFATNEVYGIDIMVSTGEGRPVERTLKTTVYKRVVDQQYSLRLKSARQTLSEVSNRFTSMPFTLRALDEKKALLGITEMSRHGLVEPFPVLMEKDGAVVVQLKFTVLLLQNGPLRVTAHPLQAHSTEVALPEEIKTILNSAIRKSTKKKSNKKKKTASTGAAAEADEDME